MIMRQRTATLCLSAIAALVLFAVEPAQAGWTTLDFPGASRSYIQGMGSGKIVGWYQLGGDHGFLYDMATGAWTTLDFPGAGHTAAYDVDGGVVVGEYWAAGSRNGFIYDGTSWATLSFPGAPFTIASGIDGTSIVGYYGHRLDGSDDRGFLYDMVTKTWTSLDAPGASRTYAQGIDMDARTGGVIVGYAVTGTDYGWLYDIDTKTFTTFDGPGGALTSPCDIQGNNIIGTYYDGGGTGHGFLYDGANWTTLDFPGAVGTYPFGIEGSLIAGYYDAPGSPGHGFLYEMEPRVIEGALNIDPDTLNLNSQGKWVTCYVELPEGHEATDIDVDSVSLEGLLEVQQSDIQDGVLMVKFDREDLAAYLDLVLGVVPPVAVELVVTGNLTDGTPFEGSDTIRVIDEGGGK